METKGVPDGSYGLDLWSEFQFGRLPAPGSLRELEGHE